MRVQVYYNLHKHKWSIREKSTGKVVAHWRNVALSNTKFVVQKGGRAKVLRESRKNVHAWVEGDICNFKSFDQDSNEITYNPYKYDSFVYKNTEEKVTNGVTVVMSNRRLWEVSA